MRVRLAIVAALGVGCSHSTQVGAPPVAPSPPLHRALVAPLAAAPAADPFASVNLGFEQVTEGRPSGWAYLGDGYEQTSVADIVHGGSGALRVRATPLAKTFGAALSNIPAAPFIGKHLRLHGFIRTEAAGGAGLYMSVSGTPDAFDNMGGRMIRGTTPWTEAVVEVDVLPGAKTLSFGAGLTGSGTAWFDDLHFELTPAMPPKPIALEGVVTDERGPVAGADVALFAPSSGQGIHAHVLTDGAGRFHFDATAGYWSVSANRAGTVGAFIATRRYDADARDLSIVLGARGGVTVHGHTSTRPSSASTPSMYLAIGLTDDEVFAVPLAADGTFEATLPLSDKYAITGIGGEPADAQEFARAGDRVDATLQLPDLAPAPEDVVRYIGTHGIPITTVEAGHGFADLAPVGKLVGNAHIVGLGEATHGTREFFQMKHRILEYLVAERGFTLFAMEANQPECRTVNDYVLHGTGDARAALKGIYFWDWNTEEVRAMIEWMRAWNADPKHAHKVEFAGFDMQIATVARANVTAYLKQVGAADSDKLDELAAAFDAHRAAWIHATSARAFADARHDLVILQQHSKLPASGIGVGVSIVRDEAMADNIAWLREQHPGVKMVVWAHNGHVANSMGSVHNMGGYLRARAKSDYVNLGFLFGDGSFQAIGGPGKGQLAEWHVGPAPAYNASAAFARTGKPLLVLDLRALPKTGVVHDWFAEPHPVREIGALFVDDETMTQQMVLPELYDAVIYVATTTRARELPGG
jgi:erythromycin esterase